MLSPLIVSALQVGGVGFVTVLTNMNLFGRVAVCGSISTYNEAEKPLSELITVSINRAG